MGIAELFEVQRKLDDNIKKVKGLSGGLEDKKVTSALTALYKCVNEVGYHKYWEEQSVPNTSEICLRCQGSGVVGYETVGNIKTAQECGVCYGEGIFANPILREYVQLLSFTVSIANDLKVKNYKYKEKNKEDCIVFYEDENTVDGMVRSITELYTLVLKVPVAIKVDEILDRVIRLGYLLGLNEEEVKNEFHIVIGDRARELLDIQCKKRCDGVRKEEREKVEQSVAQFYWEQEMRCMEMSI